MTREELDALWFEAMRQSIEEGENFVRYHFAALVAAEERKALKEERRRAMDEIYSLREAEESLREEVERLREALKKYGQHRSDCAKTLGGYQCTCGFKQWKGRAADSIHDQAEAALRREGV